MYRPGDHYYGQLTTASPTTQAATDADTLPVATAAHNGADDAAFVLTVTRLDTGRYRVDGVVPGGYAKGDTVIITVAATVGGVAGKEAIDRFRVDTKLTGDLQDAPALTDYQQRGVAVTLPTSPPAGFLGAVTVQTDKLVFDAAGNLLAVSAAAVLGTVSDATPAAGSFDGAAGLSGANGFYAGSVLAFTGGANRGLARKVTNYTGATHTFNFTGQPGAADAPFPQAPANGDGFMVLGRIG